MSAAATSGSAVLGTVQVGLGHALLFAGREYSTAAVMFHNAVAERFGLSVTDLKTLDLLQRGEARLLRSAERPAPAAHQEGSAESPAPVRAEVGPAVRGESRPELAHGSVASAVHAPQGATADLDRWGSAGRAASWARHHAHLVPR